MRVSFTCSRSLRFPPQSVFLLLIVLSSTFATPWVSLVQPPKRVEPKKPDLDLCPVCIQFAGEFINELLNVVLSEGVLPCMLRCDVCIARLTAWRSA